MTSAYRPLAHRRPLGLAGLLVACLAVLTACDSGSRRAAADGREAARLTLAAYTTPREAYEEILPAFRADWARDHADGLEVHESYMASGAQARAILGGFEADVAALSLEPDLESLRRAGLIAHDWKARPHGGMVTRSIVVIGVRAGNPKNIRDWSDLAKPGVSVLTPNVRTSGGARWNIAAIWGAAMRGKTGAPAGSPEAATALLSAILRNVETMDPGARESMLSFERGIGDAVITYENEILVGQRGGQTYEYVIPAATILIENPVALVDGVAGARGSRAAAVALLDFLITPDAQRVYARHGFRPVAEEVEQEVAASFPRVADLFTIRDLGGWESLEAALFGTGSSYEKAVAMARKP